MASLASQLRKIGQKLRHVKPPKEKAVHEVHQNDLFIGTLDKPIEEFGNDVWCCILQFVDIQTLLCFGCTCQFAHKLINDIACRDLILSKMEITHIEYQDSSKTSINKIGPSLISNPVGNILVYYSYEHPGDRCDVRVTMGFFKGTKTKFYYYHSPGRCDNFILRIYNDGDIGVQEFYLNSSSHSTSFFNYNIDDDGAQFVRGGPCEREEDWDKALGILKRLLTLAGFNTDMESWIQFSKKMRICEYYTVMFVPKGPELDEMVGNTYRIYQWLEAKKFFW